MSSVLVSLALQAHEASPATLSLEDLVALARAVLDQDENPGDTAPSLPDPPRDQARLERARSVRRLLAALLPASREPEGLVPSSLAAELVDLHDRADELVDTMLWATERRDLLLEVIRRETS